MKFFNSQKVLAVGQTSGSGGWVKKLALITMKGNGLLIAFGNPKKAMSNSTSPFEGVSSNLDHSMVFPRNKDVWLSCNWEFLVNFCVPDRPIFLIGDKCLLLRYPTHIFFSLSLILRERGHHELPSFSPIIFLRLLAFFPVGEKHIAPGMQCIEYAVIHKTRRTKRELHNKVDKLEEYSPVCTQSGLFISDLSSYVGLENAKF